MDDLVLLSTLQLSTNLLIMSPLRSNSDNQCKQPVQPGPLLSWECLLPYPVPLLQGYLLAKGGPGWGRAQTVQKVEAPRTRRYTSLSIKNKAIHGTILPGSFSKKEDWSWRFRVRPPKSSHRLSALQLLHIPNIG